MRWNVTELPRSVGTMLEQENETGSTDVDSGVLELMNGDKRQCTVVSVRAAVGSQTGEDTITPEGRQGKG